MESFRCWMDSSRCFKSIWTFDAPVASPALTTLGIGGLPRKAAPKSRTWDDADLDLMKRWRPAGKASWVAGLAFLMVIGVIGRFGRRPFQMGKVTASRLSPL